MKFRMLVLYGQFHELLSFLKTFCYIILETCPLIRDYRIIFLPFAFMFQDLYTVLINNARLQFKQWSKEDVITIVLAHSSMHVYPKYECRICMQMDGGNIMHAYCLYNEIVKSLRKGRYIRIPGFPAVPSFLP